MKAATSRIVHCRRPRDRPSSSIGDAAPAQTKSSRSALAGPGVEGDHGIAVDIGHVADAAEVQHHHGLRKPLRRGRGDRGRERRALAARCDVRVAEAVDRVDAQLFGNPLAPSELAGEAASGR